MSSVDFSTPYGIITKKVRNFAHLKEIIMEPNDYKVKLSQFVAFFVIAFGLYLLTGSYLMMAGIFMLLLVAVPLLAKWITRNIKDKEEQTL